MNNVADENLLACALCLKNEGLFELQTIGRLDGVRFLLNIPVLGSQIV